MLNANSSKAMGFICLSDIMHSRTMNKITQIMGYGLGMGWWTDAK